MYRTAQHRDPSLLPKPFLQRRQKAVQCFSECSLYGRASDTIQKQT